MLNMNSSNNKTFKITSKYGVPIILSYQHELSPNLLTQLRLNLHNRLYILTYICFKKNAN